jgi:hypothetical protein
MMRQEGLVVGSNIPRRGVDLIHLVYLVYLVCLACIVHGTR